MGCDKTRLIAILDQPAGDGLVKRTPDPEDRDREQAMLRLVLAQLAGRPGSTQ